MAIAGLGLVALLALTAISAPLIAPYPEDAAGAVSAMGVMDVFAFPLFGASLLRGVLVLYLPPESRSLAERDVTGLEAVGELLTLLADVTRERVAARV